MSNAHPKNPWIDRRKTHRVEVTASSVLSYCEVFDFRTNLTLYGRIHNFSPGGLALSLRAPLEKDDVLLVIFIDDVTARKISTYVRVIAPHVSSVFEQMLIGIDSVFSWFIGRCFVSRRYRCQVHPSPNVSEAFRELYNRLLNDEHLGELSKQRASSSSQRRLTESEDSEVTFKVAETREEREAAYRLVYDEYARRGYLRETQQKIYTSIHHLVPTTTVFVGKCNGEVVITMTAVKDSPLLLPMDAVFADYLEPFRKKQRGLVEFSSLAMKPEFVKSARASLRSFKRMDLMLSLFRFCVQETTARYTLTDLVIAVNQRYAKFYRDFYFKPLGSPRKDPSYGKTALVALWLDLEKAMDPSYHRTIGRMSLFTYFFKSDARKRNVVAPKYMSKEDIQYLFVEKSKLLANLKPEDELNLFQSFPTLKARISSIKSSS